MITTSLEEINWDSVVNDELPKLYNYFRYRLGDETVAEDLTSVVLEKAWLKRHRYRRDRASFSAWLFAIAKNEVVAYLRKRPISVPLSMGEKAPDETAEHILEHSQDRVISDHTLWGCWRLDLEVQGRTFIAVQAFDEVRWQFSLFE